MTRLAILADIHGNLPALQAVLDDIQQFNVDQVVVAGDNINMGPFSVEVMECIMGFAVMRGNHEYYLLDYQTERAPAHWHDYTQPPWLNATIPTRWRNVIATLPDALQLRFPDAPNVRVVHGSPRSHWESIFALTPDEEVLPMLEGVEENLVITGHTHLQMDRQVGRWRVINPGPLGMPLDGYYEANYMLLDSTAVGWTPTFRRVAYDITPLLEEFERIGFVETCGATGKMIYEEFASARPRIDPFNRWRRQVYPEQPATMAMTDEFMAIEDKWQYMLPPFRINMDV